MPEVGQTDEAVRITCCTNKYVLLGRMWIYVVKIHTLILFSNNAVTGAKSVRSSSYRAIRSFHMTASRLARVLSVDERIKNDPKFSLVLLLGARIAANPIHRLPNPHGICQTKGALKWLPLLSQVWQQRMNKKDEKRIVRIKTKTGGIIFQQE